MSQQTPCLVVTLASNTQRRRSMELALQRAGIQAEIGTSLSHISIYWKMIEHKLPYAVILEDDVCLDSDFARLLQSGSTDALESLFPSSGPAMIQLSHVHHAYRQPEKRLGTTARTAVRPYGGVWLASCYFITLPAAERKVRAGPARH